MISKLKRFVESWADELFLIVLIVGVALISFGMGRLSAYENYSGDLVIQSTPVEASVLVESLKNPPQDYIAPIGSQAQDGKSSAGPIVGNKNSKIFHLENCSGAKSMSEANKIYFASVSDATAAGYRAAGNCPGL